jgi:hypothetical protein
MSSKKDKISDRSIVKNLLKISLFCYIIYVLSIILHLYIKFQYQISNNERSVKRTKFLTDL